MAQTLLPLVEDFVEETTIGCCDTMDCNLWTKSHGRWMCPTCNKSTSICARCYNWWRTNYAPTEWLPSVCCRDCYFRAALALPRNFNDEWVTLRLTRQYNRVKGYE